MRMAFTTSSGSSRMSVTSAASMATSVPLPMAVPTWATASGGCVVDSVTDHHRLAPVRLDGLDRCGLVLGEDLRPDVRRVDADLFGDGTGRPLVVAGDQHHVGATVVECGDGRFRTLLDRVRVGDDADEVAVHGYQHRRLPLVLQALHRLGSGSGVDARVAQEFAVANQDPLPSTVARMPWPGTFSNVSASGTSIPRSSAPSTMARASGCSLPLSAAAASRRTPARRALQM